MHAFLKQEILNYLSNLINIFLKNATKGKHGQIVHIQKCNYALKWSHILLGVLPVAACVGICNFSRK